MPGIEKGGGTLNSGAEFTFSEAPDLPIHILQGMPVFESRVVGRRSAELPCR